MFMALVYLSLPLAITNHGGEERDKLTMQNISIKK